MEQPLVTVILLCYNQARFVQEAIDSVLSQNYPRIQLIVVDDASSDDSVAVIRNSITGLPVEFLPLPQNHGNCRAFNRALRDARGDFIIDLAADDILLPDRVPEGVNDLTKAGAEFGVHFSDALWITEDGRPVRRHSDHYPHSTIPQGDVYRDLVKRFFICSPTMMFRRSVIETLGGYDEDLKYEDFDFWIRSSRLYKYCYSPKVLVRKRLVKGSMSEKQFSFRSPQLESTYAVCRKILSLNRTRAEQKALSARVLYEMRVCLKWFHIGLVAKYAVLLVRNGGRRYKL